MKRYKVLMKAAAAVDAVTPHNALLKKIAAIPNLEDAQTYLFIGPHPDDVEIGAGATLDKLIKAGKTVRLVICTDGGAGSADATLSTEIITATRAEESKNSAEVLGLKDWKNLGFPDGGVYSEEELVVALAKEIYEFAPDVIFCPDPLLPTETHPDHLKVARATLTAMTVASNFYSSKRHGITVEAEKLKPSKVLAYYYTHRANSFVEVTEENMDARVRALEKHVSQFKPLERDGVLVYLGLRARDFGDQIGKKLAEGFFAIPPIAQHCVNLPE